MTNMCSTQMSIARFNFKRHCTQWSSVLPRINEPILTIGGALSKSDESSLKARDPQMNRPGHVSLFFSLVFHGRATGVLPIMISLNQGLSREVIIRVPFFLQSILVGEPSPKTLVKGHLAGGPSQRTKKRFRRLVIAPHLQGNHQATRSQAPRGFRTEQPTNQK